MSQWIKDWWPVVATVVAIIGIIVAATITIAIYKKNKPRITIDYQILSNIDLLSHDAPGVEDLEIHFRAHVLKSPRVVVIRFINTGNKPIDKEDFKKNIVVKHGDSAKALDLFLVDESTPDMLERLYDGAAGSRYTDILPILMNPGQFFTIQFLYDGSEKISATCWFKGQTRDMNLLPMVSPLDSVRGASFQILGVAVEVIGIPGASAAQAIAKSFRR